MRGGGTETRNDLPSESEILGRPKTEIRLAQSAVQSGLVSEEQLKQAESHLGRNSVAADDALIAAQLVADGVVTDYQAEQLKSGRTKFTLGPYIITDWLGQGGMGQVFKARHEMMGREVAIKVLPQDKSTPDAIASFTREIRTQAQLDHPRLVRAYDAGQDGQTYFLVTEFVPGTDLRRLVRLDGRLNMVQAASIVSQVALGLEHAHQTGLIHRDIKPGNILVTPDGTAKLSDLGLAGFLHEGESDPRSGKIVGTADYLSPEQIRDPGKIVPCSDIYSLGCTLYYSVTAKVPFPGGRTKDKVKRHLEEMPWHPRRLNPDISEEFVDLIADMMEKDPRRRLQSAAEVARRLAPWAKDKYDLPTSSGSPRSPWQAAPLPGIHDTAVEYEESSQASGLSGSQNSSPGQLSESTHPLSAASEETRVVRESVKPTATPTDPPSPIGLNQPKRRRHKKRERITGTSLTLVLGVVVPLAMLVGALLAVVIMTVMNQ